MDEEREILNKLFLELSRVTTAKTSRELNLATLVVRLVQALKKTEGKEWSVIERAEGYLKQEGFTASLLRGEY